MPFPAIAWTRSFVLASLALLAGVAPSRAVERVVHRFDERDGLAVAETSLLAQDSRGFLWIGTIGGLYRFDGAEIRAWAPEQVRHVVKVLAAGPEGRLVVAGDDEPLWEVTRMGVEPVIGPRGEPIRDWIDADWAHDAALWVAIGDTLWRRDTSNEWRSWSSAEFDGRPFFALHPLAGDSILVATRDDVWVAGGTGALRRRAEIPFAVAAQPLDSTRHVVLSRRSGVWEMDANRARLLHALPAGAADLALRDGTIWVTQDRFLWSLAPDGSVRAITSREGIPPGRPILVDREGTLWIGGLRGLLGLPEPETVAWNELDGLADPPHAHHLARSADAVWVVTWFGSSRLERDGDSSRVVAIGGHSGRIRPDPRGRMWAADLDRGFVRWDDRTPTRFSYPGVHGLYGTSHRPDGTMWLSTDDGLFLAPADDSAPRFLDVPVPPSFTGEWTSSWLGPCFQDSRGRFWVGHGEEMLSCDADSLAAALPVHWKVHPLPGAWLVNDIVELPDGAIWIGTGNMGVQRLEGDRFVPLPGNRALPSLRIYGLVASPSGGAWVLAAGCLVRVLPRDDLDDGWEIVERLGAWQGVPSAQASDLWEDADGRLWLASLAGLIEVPPVARRTEVVPPSVELVDLRVDGTSLRPEEGIRLPWNQNRIEVRFAALTFRERSLLRYQFRLDPRSPWQESREPTLRFVELAPGSYRAEVRASLDGVRWTPDPRPVQFTVLPPWWRTPWALAAFLLLAGAALYALHRARVAILLQLERQRTRIAMDLHDEIGSGLGSIGILAGLAAEERLDESKRREISSSIGQTSSALGDALGEIVKSLQRGADTLETFALRLAGQARRLAPGEAPRLILALPSRWPEVRLAPKVQRELHAIAAEALHNAVRHAHARTLELSLAPDRDSWILRVRDDGVGIPAKIDPQHSGHGLANMRTRAAAIGAELHWSSPPEGGTVVDVRFRPTPPRAFRMMMRARARRGSGMLFRR